MKIVLLCLIFCSTAFAQLDTARLVNLSYNDSCTQLTGKVNQISNSDTVGARLMKRLKGKDFQIISLNFQGGCSCSRGDFGTGQSVCNQPYVNGGLHPIQAGKMDTLLKAAKDNNQIVLLGVFYFGQWPWTFGSGAGVECCPTWGTPLSDNAIIDILNLVGQFVQDGQTAGEYGEVWFEVCNEIDFGYFGLNNVQLYIDTLRQYGPSSVSFKGGTNPPTNLDYDFILVHCNTVQTELAYINFLSSVSNRWSISGLGIYITEDPGNWLTNMAEGNAMTLSRRRELAHSFGIGWGLYDDLNHQNVPIDSDARLMDTFEDDGDLNCDGFVDLVDLSIVLDQSSFNLQDLAVVLSNFGSNS